MEISAQTAKLLKVFTVALLLCASVVMVVFQLNPSQPFGVDFAPVWTAAANPAQAYDIFAVTAVQSDLFQIPLNPRPFAYPPTALLLFAPVGWLPFPAAFPAFTMSAYGLFTWGAMRVGAPWWIAVFPPVVLLGHVGQATLLVGGLVLLAWALTDWRYRGLLFGIAIALKPQLWLFLPLALLLKGDWRSLYAAGALVALIAVTSTFAFGFPVWSEWYKSTGDLLEIVRSSPSLSANAIGGDPLLFAIPAALLLWFTRKADEATQFAGVVGAALLMSPYAMNYELALLAPAVAAASRSTPWMLIASLILGLSFFVLELIVLVFVLLALLWHSRHQVPLAPATRATTVTVGNE